MTPPIADSNISMFQPTSSSASSPDIRMPHVFVIPPEEEQQDNPPWCCFDADEQPENNDDLPSSPDIHFFDVPYLFQSPGNDITIPLTRRTSVHQPRPRATLSKKLEKKQRPEALKIIESKLSRSSQRDPREDSDVVEVVKVKRARETSTDLEENIKAKRSKTFKARATKALQSIKNVGKTSHKTHVGELWSSSESTPGIFKGMQEQIRLQLAQAEDRPPSTPPKKGSLSRKASRSLAQIFQPTKLSRGESPFAIRVPSPVAHAEAYHTLPAANPSSASHLRYNHTNSSLNEVPVTLTTDDAPNRPASPLPSTKKKNTLTKFSVRDLHRLFSFSSSSHDDPPTSPTATAIPSSFANSSSRPSTSPSALSCDLPDISMEDDIFEDAHFVNLESPDRRAASRYHQALHTSLHDNFSTLRRLSDLSFEMKLDSLRFDSLSFNPDDFGVTRGGERPTVTSF